MRPRKCRHVRLDPQVRFYKPRGVPLCDLQVLELRHEELEALSLADLRRLEHAEAAALMNVSRPTFSRVLAQARRTVAAALVGGAALRISGGDFLHVGPPRVEAAAAGTFRGGATGAATAPRGDRHERKRKQ